MDTISWVILNYSVSNDPVGELLKLPSFTFSFCLPLIFVSFLCIDSSIADSKEKKKFNRLIAHIEKGG